MKSNETVKNYLSDIYSTPLLFNTILDSSSPAFKKEDEKLQSQKEKLIQRFKQPSTSTQSTPHTTNNNLKNRISKIFALSESEERVGEKF